MQAYVETTNLPASADSGVFPGKHKVMPAFIDARRKIVLVVFGAGQSAMFYENRGVIKGLPLAANEQFATVSTGYVGWNINRHLQVPSTPWYQESMTRHEDPVMWQRTGANAALDQTAPFIQTGDDVTPPPYSGETGPIWNYAYLADGDTAPVADANGFKILKSQWPNAVGRTIKVTVKYGVFPAGSAPLRDAEGAVSNLRPCATDTQFFNLFYGICDSMIDPVNAAIDEGYELGSGYGLATVSFTFTMPANDVLIRCTDKANSGPYVFGVDYAPSTFSNDGPGGHGLFTYTGVTGDDVGKTFVLANMSGDVSANNGTYVIATVDTDNGLVGIDQAFAAVGDANDGSITVLSGDAVAGPIFLHSVEARIIRDNGDVEPGLAFMPWAFRSDESTLADLAGLEAAGNFSAELMASFYADDPMFSRQVLIWMQNVANDSIYISNPDALADAHIALFDFYKDRFAAKGMTARFIDVLEADYSLNTAAQSIVVASVADDLGGSAIFNNAAHTITLASSIRAVIDFRDAFDAGRLVRLVFSGFEVFQPGDVTNNRPYAVESISDDGKTITVDSTTTIYHDGTETVGNITMTYNPYTEPDLFHGMGTGERFVRFMLARRERNLSNVCPLLLSELVGHRDTYMMKWLDEINNGLHYENMQGYVEVHRLMLREFCPASLGPSESVDEILASFSLTDRFDFDEAAGPMVNKITAQLFDPQESPSDVSYQQASPVPGDMRTCWAFHGSDVSYAAARDNVAGRLHVQDAMTFGVVYETTTNHTSGAARIVNSYDGSSGIAILILGSTGGLSELLVEIRFNSVATVYELPAAGGVKQVYPNTPIIFTANFIDDAMEFFVGGEPVRPVRREQTDLFINQGTTIGQYSNARIKLLFTGKGTRPLWRHRKLYRALMREGFN